MSINLDKNSTLDRNSQEEFLQESLKSFNDYLEKSTQRINQVLKEILNTYFEEAKYQHHQSPCTHSKRLTEALSYCIFNGGKRLRPILVYATGEYLNVPLKNLDKAAAAVELIHCYSLIHDDLPAMDNDDWRRGKPTCHKAFDEATAILAGDALHALAFEVLSKADDSISPQNQLKLIQILAKNCGLQGMVGGQALDMETELFQEATITTVKIDDLINIHRKKTGALISTSIQLACIIADCQDKNTQAALERYAECIGLSFQVQDDILDVIGDKESLGKTIGKDLKQNKATFPMLLGFKQAKEFAFELHQEALNSLSKINNLKLSQSFETLDSLKILEMLSEYFIKRII